VDVGAVAGRTAAAAVDEMLDGGGCSSSGLGLFYSFLKC
jgi:hypothetical protein